GDGVGDFTVLSKVADATTTPQRRLVILGSRATSGTSMAGASLESSGEVGAAKLVDDLTGDGRRDLIVLTKTRDNANWDDADPSSWDENLFRVHARIASIPASGTGTVDLDAAPAVGGLPEAGYSEYAGSIFGLRVADIEGDERLEIGLSLTDRLLLASTTTTDRLAPELFDDRDRGLTGVVLPNAAINPADGAPRALRMREAGVLTLEYRRDDGSLAGTEDRSLPVGTTRDVWRATVGAETLPSGTYTLRATPRDGFGNRGKTQTRQVVISGGSTAATIDVETRFTRADGSVITPGGGSYRFSCASADVTNGTWVGTDNLTPARIDTSDMPTPPVAGAACELRLSFFAGDLPPGACTDQPNTVTVNGQPVAVSTPVVIPFTVQPGANRIVHARG
ncbi:MAG: hypothetical protein Q7V62_09090, partial [Actinomycetota bacterium]|nr:hypothetical protein [Actinomycetota bacterium]